MNEEKRAQKGEENCLKLKIIFFCQSQDFILGFYDPKAGLKFYLGSVGSDSFSGSSSLWGLRQGAWTL